MPRANAPGITTFSEALRPVGKASDLQSDIRRIMKPLTARKIKDKPLWNQLIFLIKPSGQLAVN